MLRVLFGMIVGVYMAQNYSVPNVESIFRDFRNILKEYRKPPVK